MAVASEWDNVLRLSMLYYMDENHMSVSIHLSSVSALKIHTEVQLKYILKCNKYMTRKCFEVF